MEYLSILCLLVFVVMDGSSDEGLRPFVVNSIIQKNQFLRRTFYLYWNRKRA